MKSGFSPKILGSDRNAPNTSSQQPVQNGAILLDKKRNIFELIQENDLQALKSLMESTINKKNLFEQKNDKKLTPLLYAVTKGHIGIVDYLVKNGDSVKQITINNINALHLAAKHGHTALIAYLVDHHELNIAERDSRGWTVLHFAADQGQNSTVKYLASRPQLLYNKTNLRGQTALDLAALGGRIDIFETIISLYRLRPEKARAISFSLYLAASYGHIAFIDHFVSKYDANPLEKHNGQSVLHFAALGGCVNTFSQLVSRYGLKVADEDKNEKTVLHYAIESGSIALVDHLLKHYVFNLTIITNEMIFPNWANEIEISMRNASLLFQIIKDGDFIKIEQCLKAMSATHKAMILNWLNEEGKRPLILCLEKNKVDLITLLLWHGASIDNLYFESSAGEETSDTFNHALIRSTCLRTKGELILHLHESLLKRVTEGCQTKGPYQDIDRQILAKCEPQKKVDLLETAPPLTRLYNGKRKQRERVYAVTGGILPLPSLQPPMVEGLELSIRELSISSPRTEDQQEEASAIGEKSMR